MVIIQRKNQRKKWIEIVSRDNFWEKLGLIIDICCIPESQPPKKKGKRKRKKKKPSRKWLEMPGGGKCQSERKRGRRRRVEHTDGERESG
jgi:hypothetical protein